MNVRQKLLAGYLVVALLVVATALTAWLTDAASARRAAALEAAQVARGIGKDIALGLPVDTPGEVITPLYDHRAALTNFINRLHDNQRRDIVVVDTTKYILGDALIENIGSVFDHDTGDEVGRTIADGRSRVFVEQSVDYPQGIKQVVVQMTRASGVVVGAVILEYTPLYEQMLAGTRQAQIIILCTGSVAFLSVLLIGFLLATSLTRRITALTTAVRVIRTGDYSHRVPVTGGRDEIGRLAGAFNAMAGELDRSAREILAKEYTDSILANAGEGICGLDTTGRIAFANAAAGRITGLGVAGLLDRDAAEVLPETAGLTAATREGRLQRADGTSVTVEYTVNAIEKDGRTIGAVILLRDVTRQHALEYDLRHQALHDGLTGLPNRKLLLDRLEHALTRSRAASEPLAVLYLDLDGFKRVNDSLGHNAGDLLLRTAAERLTGVLRAQDTVARLGGDEFAVLLENAVPEAVERVAQDCLDALARPFLIHNREVLVTVSIGVVPDAARYTSADEVLRNADVAMYAAKDQGKNRFLTFENRMHEQLLSRLDQESRLRDAVHRGELRMHLQPVVSVPDGQMVGAEALVRWQDPQHGLRQPGSFIPLAEETGMIVEIDRWVLMEACRTIKQWQDDDPATAPAWVSVNLSAAHLEVPDLTDRIAYALSTSGLPARCLVLELTETILMRDIAVTAARLEELRELGVKIAIDDFGTGYSSLGYLRDIPVDVLKIDRSFITGMTGNGRQQELVNAVIQLGHMLGLRVVVEGIEEADQLALLSVMGCKFVQGYHLGRPVPADELRVLRAAPAVLA
ncbi:putative bifunctional diguanylate cyclase/phosphodiesterase [Actinoplanes awajinensis]|uniref:Diguanylate cyclase n=1 Tax=Actinoplanes awajinensis subsp. mycoplanecinus TaxID=135947 RepID=A0A101JN47_9ACTN|nr:EAL domain-containing protein [Actinoplanes awajinensis]KUL29881.1 diguanylate cyclase [Actinoplanes awajinensis subsp. mycoplanecinus]